MADWERIDDLIMGGVTILAIKEIRVQTGCSLREAIGKYHERAALLSQTRPGEFKLPSKGMSDESCWRSRDRVRYSWSEQRQRG